tara:strand:+ start:281 stop:574 length:294 start_codon:yes stop_codon:yes gene_type:complete
LPVLIILLVILLVTYVAKRAAKEEVAEILDPVPQVKNYFNATGGFRTGIVAAPLTEKIIAPCIVGEKPPFPVEPFLMSRFEKNKFQPTESRIRSPLS